MKIECFEKFLKSKSVSFYKIGEMEMDLRNALSLGVETGLILGRDNVYFNNLFSSDVYRPDYNYSSYRLRRIPHYMSENELRKFPLKINGKTEIHKGIFIYEDEKDLCEFLLKYLDVKNNNCGIVKNFNSCLNSKGKLSKEKVLNKIESGDYDFHFVFFNKKSKRIFYNSTNKQIVILSEMPDEIRQNIIAVFKETKINGYSIPQIDYLYYGFNKNYKEQEKVVVIYINNEIKVYEDISDINRGIIDYFDKNGRLYSMSYIDLLPDKTKKVFAILKVPSKAEYKKLKKAKKGKSKFDWILNKPFFVSPCLKTVFLEKDIPVIDDVEIFENIITTVAAGIYIPENIKSEFDINWLNDKNDFLFLEKPV